MDRRTQIVTAALVDMGVVTWKGFRGKAPTKLPPPWEYPLILLVYGLLWTLSDSEAGAGAVALGWLLVLGALLNVGNLANLGTQLGAPSHTITPTSPTKG